MSTTMTTQDLLALHARYDAKDAAAPLADCLACAERGELYEVDTQNAGADALVCADSAEEAIAQVAASVGREPGTEGAAAVERWTARAIRWAAWERESLSDEHLVALICDDPEAAAVYCASQEVQAARSQLWSGHFLSAEGFDRPEGWQESAGEWARKAREQDEDDDNEDAIRAFEAAFCRRCAAAFAAETE